MNDVRLETSKMWPPPCSAISVATSWVSDVTLDMLSRSMVSIASAG